MDKKALQARREYQRKWRAANRDKVQAAQVRYWTKKGQQEAERDQRAETV